MNPHTFEPAPSNATALAVADLVIANGLDLEDPTLALANASLKQGAEIVTLGDKTITPGHYTYASSFPRDQGIPNPHL